MINAEAYSLKKRVVLIEVYRSINVIEKSDDYNCPKSFNDKNGYTRVNTGTGVIVNKNQILTAFHNLHNDIITDESNVTLESRLCFLAYFVNNNDINKPIILEVKDFIDFDSPIRNDLVFINIKNTVFKEYENCAKISKRDYKSNEGLYVYGFSTEDIIEGDNEFKELIADKIFREKKSFKLSGKCEYGGSKCKLEGVVSPGYSGGPVFDEKNQKLIGILISSSTGTGKSEFLRLTGKRYIGNNWCKKTDEKITNLKQKLEELEAQVWLQLIPNKTKECHSKVGFLSRINHKSHDVDLDDEEFIPDRIRLEIEFDLNLIDYENKFKSQSQTVVFSSFTNRKRIKRYGRGNHKFDLCMDYVKNSSLENKEAAELLWDSISTSTYKSSYFTLAKMACKKINFNFKPKKITVSFGKKNEERFSYLSVISAQYDIDFEKFISQSKTEIVASKNFEPISNKSRATLLRVLSEEIQSSDEYWNYKEAEGEDCD